MRPLEGLSLIELLCSTCARGHITPGAMQAYMLRATALLPSQANLLIAGHGDPVQQREPCSDVAGAEAGTILCRRGWIVTMTG